MEKKRNPELLLQHPPLGDADLEHRFLESNILLHAVTTTKLGSKDRPLIVFLHGFPEMWTTWRHQITEFKRHFEILALDMRGYGLSDAPRGIANYSIAQLCFDIKTAIHAAGHTSCYLVAHDWGGAVAWCFAANHPDMVDRLAVLCSPHPAAYTDPKRFDAKQSKKSWYFMLFMARFLPEIWLRQGDYNQIEKLMIDAPFGVRRKAGIIKDDVELLKTSFDRHPYALTAAVNYYRAAIVDQTCRPSVVLKTGLEAVLEMPVLVMYADNDSAFNESMFEKEGLKKNVKGSLTVVKLENCSHWAPQDRPDAVNAALKEFFYFS